MRVILLGPPGAGKGTQAKKMAERLRLVHVSTGDILRQNVSSNMDLGKEARSYMEKGVLVPDELVTRMLSERINQPDIKKGFILDGYPRNLNQAEALDEILKQKNMSIDLVIYLDTSDPVIMQRLTGRLVCKTCGANFHIKNMPPKKQGICDYCAGKLYQRSDDKEETIKARLEVYQKESAPLIQYYQKKEKLSRVLADEEADIVLEKMIRLAQHYHDTNKV